MYTAEEIGNAIKKRRRQLKITQKEFAERLGKSERTIQKYESGEITMKIDLIKLVADELEIPWQELLEAKTDEIGIVSSENEFPACRFHTLSDVINALFIITEIKDIAFQLTCAKPPESPDWTSALMVDGKGSGTYNADFCLFMENWLNKLAALQSGSINQEQFETWKRETLEYYSDSYFSDFISQRAKSRKVKGKQKKVDYSTIQIVSTREEPDNNE
ncbi:transcriptional regulator [Enterocloster clostridioformis]|nr:transcriptional regulator [Lachnoclostridium sp. YL32]NDO30070.1 helix-turn-helix transcriptional regulator [Enterocloster clostridioformis]OXE67893.1 transcriptional regulator [Enterocloster clostridioformis]QQR04108.1 helix-turn-helix transcriptional regulator [Enterocloster clostridioformis]